MTSTLETTQSSNDYKWERPTVFYNKKVKYLIYILIVSFFLFSFYSMRIPLDRLILGFGATIELLNNMWPPATSERELTLIWNGTIETLGMTAVATVAGVAISLPVGFMSAENIAPKPVYLFGRGLISVSRAFHELVLAIIAVVAFGFGPFAGVVAIVFNTIGFFGKLLAEDIEDLSEVQIEGIKATGASKTQVILYSVIPQVMPRIIGLSVYRADINLRKGTVVGIVGAGGIGATLINAFNSYSYDFALTILVVIIALVLVGEFTSAYLRKEVM